jgi:hypothetical protein
MPDPKLQPIMDEIKAVLVKHDISAMIVLGSDTHVLHVEHFDTKTCLMKVNERGLLRFLLEKSDYPDAAALSRAVEHTAAVIAGFMDSSRDRADDLERMLRIIGQYFVVRHFTIREALPPNPPPPNTPAN